MIKLTVMLCKNLENKKIGNKISLLRNLRKQLELKNN